MVGETGHLCPHQGVGAGLNGCRHQVIKVDGVAEVSGEGAEIHGRFVHGVGMVAVGTGAAYGPFPETEKLCRRRRHAAGYRLYGIATILINRTHAVVVGILVPSGLDERSHNHRAGGAFLTVDGLPLGGNLFCRLMALTDGRSDLLAVALQHVVETCGNLSRVESSFGGVAQHRLRTVVGGDDDKTLSSHVHHVVAGDFRGASAVASGSSYHIGGLIDNLRLDAARLRGNCAEKLLRHRLGLCRINGVR